MQGHMVYDASHVEFGSRMFLKCDQKLKGAELYM